MTQFPVVTGPSSCSMIQKVYAVAQLLDIKVTKKTDGRTGVEFEGGLFLHCPAALRHLARMRPCSLLYGSTLVEASLIDSWMHFAEKNISQPLQVFFFAGDKISAAEKTAINNTVADSLRTFVEPALAGKKFLVGNALSIADIDMAASLNKQRDSIPADLKNVLRWLNEVTAHPKIASALTSALCTRSSGKEQDSKPAKATGANDIEDAIAAEAKAKAKKTNPLDLLPASTFKNDAWKGVYSNTKDLRGVAMPEFWKTFDNSGWSCWYMRYDRLEGENTVSFATSNMLGGFLQRLDNAFRKYSFGVLNILNSGAHFDIEGVWMWRGLEIPFELEDHPSFDCYTFRKLDLTKEADKELLTDFWCSEEEIKGRQIDSCKVWK